MSRRKWKWTPLQIDRLNQVIDILNELKDYQPVTLRQIHYQLVGKNLVENTTSNYGMLSKLVKYARIDGHIPWKAIEDRVRYAYLNRGWRNQEHFLETERSNFLKGYGRDLQQGQDNYLEVWLEKDALSGIFQRMLRPFYISLCPARGFSSVSFLNDLRNRILSSQKKGQQAIMLYFGDLDPSGDIMLPSMKTTLEGEMEVTGIKYDPVALTPEQIKQYNLPVKMASAKKTDSRYKKFREKHGDQAVELDALSPKQLEEIIAKATTKYIDLSKVEYHREETKKERTTLKDFRQKVETFIDDNWNITDQKES